MLELIQQTEITLLGASDMDSGDAMQCMN